MTQWLQRIWLAWEGYCWSHTKRWCVVCPELKRKYRLQVYQERADRRKNLAYKIRSRREEK